MTSATGNSYITATARIVVGSRDEVRDGGDPVAGMDGRRRDVGGEANGRGVAEGDFGGKRGGALGEGAGVLAGGDIHSNSYSVHLSSATSVMVRLLTAVS